MHRTSQYDIDARNKVNLMADGLESALIKAMGEFAGKKVWKVSGRGGFTAATAKALDSLIEVHGLAREIGWTVTFSGQGRSIWCRLKLRYETEQGHCNYAEEAFRIGQCDDHGILTAPETQLTYPNGRRQFTQGQVESALQAADDLEAQAWKLRSTVSCFRR